MLCASPCDSNERGIQSTMSVEYLLPFQMSLAMMKDIILLSYTPEKNYFEGQPFVQLSITNKSAFIGCNSEYLGRVYFYVCVLQTYFHVISSFQMWKQACTKFWWRKNFKELTEANLWNISGIFVFCIMERYVRNSICEHLKDM